MFVGELPYSVGEDRLKEDFSECGEVVKIDIVRGDGGNSRGMELIEYERQKGVDAALKYDGDDYEGHYLKR